jgi:protoporphyrinogen oxidase
VIGLPGDTVLIDSNKVYINRQLEKIHDSYQKNYIIQLVDSIEKFKYPDTILSEKAMISSKMEYAVSMSEKVYWQLKKDTNVTGITYELELPLVFEHDVFPYNEKLWNYPLNKLTTKWLGRFVPSTTLDDILNGLINDKSSEIGYNAYFYYPEKGGIEAIIRDFYEKIKDKVKVTAFSKGSYNTASQTSISGRADEKRKSNIEFSFSDGKEFNYDPVNSKFSDIYKVEKINLNADEKNKERKIINNNLK